MKQVNVLHVIDHMGMGGAQRIVIELLRKWDEENIKLFCYALRVSNNSFGHSNKQAFYSSNNKSKYDLFSFFELKNFVKKKDIKILHLHLAKSIMFGILLKMFYFKDVKIIVHEHGRIYENNFWYNYFLRILQDKIDLFIAVSEATKRMLIKNAKIKQNKIKILYNFVDLEQFDSQKMEINILEERTKLGFREEDFVIGLAGRHIERKGFRDLIIAMDKIKNYEYIKLLILGNGPKKEEYEKLVKKLGLSNSITFLGFIPDIKKFYLLIDCIVIPSHWEPSPMIFYEVQAMGVPLISSNAESLNELVSDSYNGVIFDVRDTSDLARKIIRLYENQNLQTNIIKNSLINAKIYSIEAHSNKIKTIYYSLIEIQKYDQ